MKKVIALVLAVLMMFALCACGSSIDAEQVDNIVEALQGINATLNSMLAAEEAEAEAEAEEEPAEEPEEAAESDELVIEFMNATTVDNDTGDFVWNGQYEVWSILPTTGAQGLVMINDAMGEMMEAAGFTYVKKDSEGNPSNQIDFVEDAIAAGNVGCLMIAAMDVDLLEEPVAAALDAGIAVVMLGAQPDYPLSGSVYTAYEITGQQAVKAAEDWVVNRVAEGGNVPATEDGKYEIALDTYTEIKDGVYRSNAMYMTVQASDVLTFVSETTSYGDSAYIDAYNNAKDIMESHPDCRIIVCYEPEESMGTADAIADRCADDDSLDLADFCVISCYAEDDTFKEMYAEGLADPSSSAVKGYVNYGDDQRGGVTMPGYLCTGYHLADALLYACGLDIDMYVNGEFVCDSTTTWTTAASGGVEYGGTYYDTIVATNIYGFSYSWVNGEDNPAIDYKVNEKLY